MHAKYTQKMEDMILRRYRNSTSLQIDTAKDIYKDFKQMFSNESLKNITPARIRSKFQTMQKLRRDKHISTKTPSYNWPPESPKLKHTTFKDSMFEAMKKSDNMTITIKGTEITVVFK
tara:strand:- start:910 stop:1263 length:354 start_codon:yes stop_codon:yes gene_type:complete